MINFQHHNPLPPEFTPSSAWQIRLSTSSLGLPCDLCGSKFIRFPFEVITQTGKTVCPLCCRLWNRLLADLLDSYKNSINESVGEFNFPGSPTYYIFGFGSPKGNDPLPDFFTMLNEIAICLEEHDCSAFFLINIYELNFKGRPIIRSEVSNDCANSVKPGIGDILCKYPHLAKNIHYFFLWNKQKLGSIGTPVSLENIVPVMN
jgi:hypothetical protein